MSDIERNCTPPIAEKISPAAQVMLDLCYALECYTVPEANYDGTNLQGLSGLPVESLTVSDLEKVVLLAAGFTRTPEFIRKRAGTLIQNGSEGWNLCQPSFEQSFDDVIASALAFGENTIGIRVNPAKQSTGDTQPSRPYQKIYRRSDRGLIRNNGQVVGIYQRRNNNGDYDYPYYFTQGDTVELFVDPKPNEINGFTNGGGFVIKFTPDNEYEVYITTNGLNVRYVHDPIAVGKTTHIAGRLDNDVQNNPILNKFFRQDGFAISRLIQVVDQQHPNFELTLQANYAYTKKKGLLIYVFDMEIPAKIEAQWRSHNRGPVVPFFDAYNPEIALPLAQISRRFYDRYAPGD